MKTIKPLQNILQHTDAEEYAQGLSWYKEANAFVHELSEMSGYSSDIIARLLAILSPACPWERNKKDATAMALSSSPLEDVVVSTYGNNKRKAIQLLRHGDISQLSGKKVVSFYNNIINPDCPKHVTIDRHAIRACLPKNHKAKALDSDIADAQYRQAEKIYKRLAHRMNLTPCSLQAIVWVTYRNKFRK